MNLVVGATGMLGGLITRRLAAAGKPVRMLVSQGSDYRSLVEAGAEPIRGDLKDPPSLTRAVHGVTTVITTANSARRVPPDTVEAVDLNGNRELIDAARSAGVDHFVFISGTPQTTADSPVPFVAAKGMTEDRLRESGMAWTILAPEPYFEVWVAMVVAGPVLSGGEVVYVGSGERRHTMISVADVAEFAAGSVDNQAARGRRLEIGGPDAFSWKEAVAAFEPVVGRRIVHRGVPPGEAVPGVPEQVLGLLAFMDAYDSQIEMEGLAGEFGVQLTSIHDYARSVARG